MLKFINASIYMLQMKALNIYGARDILSFGTVLSSCFFSWDGSSCPPNGFTLSANLRVRLLQCADVFEGYSFP
jgi:hypothetical protein